MLKMAFQQFACRFALMTFLLCLGCHPAVTANLTIVDGVSPGTSPWLAYFFLPSRCEGSLITDQWVLTDSNCVREEDIGRTGAYVGLTNRPSSPAGRVYYFGSVVCNTENRDGNNSGICLVKLSSQVQFTNNIQAIPLASNMSTFYDGFPSWVSVGDFGNEITNISLQREVKASILGNNRCNCEQKQNNVKEKEMCARIQGSYPCQVVPGSPLVIREGSQWVIGGVANVFSPSCGDTGVFTRVSLYQDWIHQVITGMEPTFVTVSSTGIDPDGNFSCSPETTTTPIGMTTTTTTFDPTGMGTRSYRTTTHPTTTEMIYIFSTPDGSIFNGGNNLIHFTHFFSLSALVLLLHVFVGGSEM